MKNNDLSLSEFKGKVNSFRGRLNLIYIFILKAKDWKNCRQRNMTRIIITNF